MTMAAFSPKRLFLIRRLRKARRLWKKQPLFAYHMMQEQYPGYTFAEFQEDLRLRSRKRKRKGKSGLCRYGRYQKIQQLLDEFHMTRDFDRIREADRLRRNITKPYRVMIRLEGETREFEFQAVVPVERIKALVQNARACKTWSEFEILKGRVE